MRGQYDISEVVQSIDLSVTMVCSNKTALRYKYNDNKDGLMPRSLKYLLHITADRNRDAQSPVLKHQSIPPTLTAMRTAVVVSEQPAGGTRRNNNAQLHTKISQDAKVDSLRDHPLPLLPLRDVQTIPIRLDNLHILVNLE